VRERDLDSGAGLPRTVSFSRLFGDLDPVTTPTIELATRRFGSARRNDFDHQGTVCNLDNATV